MVMTTKETGFGIADTVIFIGLLVIGSLIGIYYAIKDRNSKNTDNYNYGGRNMSPIPLGLSLSVTYVSALTIISQPTESYLYGLVTVWYSFGKIIPTVIASLYFIPLLHKLKLQTIYQFLEYRFDKRIRKYISAIGIIKMILYMGFTVYVPALALNAVTPISLSWSVVLTSLVCTFYTTLGGMKAVVWTDTVQTVVMFFGGFAAMIKAIGLVGGLENVWENAERGGRLNQWNFDPDPTMRRTVFTVFFGYTFLKCHTICCTQAAGQRFLSCKSIKDARIAAFTALLPVTAITVVATLSGVVLFAFYEGCDPLKAGKISKADQLIAHLVSEVFNDTPGMAGVFVSAAYCGTLSTVSSGINSMGSLILEDFIIPIKPTLSEIAKVTIGKTIAILIGSLVALVALLAPYMGKTVVSVVFSLDGILGGPLFALFVLGMFFPWTNKAGAVIGHAFGTAFVAWIAFSAKVYGIPPEKSSLLPTTTENCTSVTALANWTTTVASTAHYPYSELEFNSTTLMVDAQPVDTKPFFYYNIWAISNLYYGIVGFLTALLTGLIVSFVTGSNKPAESDPRYFVPLVDGECFPKKVRIFFRFGVPEETEVTRNTEHQQQELVKLNDINMKEDVSEDSSIKEKDSCCANGGKQTSCC